MHISKNIVIHQRNSFLTFRYAKQISSGDEILVTENYEMIPAKVISSSNFIMQGNHILSTAPVSVICMFLWPSIHFLWSIKCCCWLFSNFIVQILLLLVSMTMADIFLFRVTQFKNYIVTHKQLENIVLSLLLGAHMPLTKDGNIVVDGVLASCYANSDHNLAHLAMTPMQWIPEGMEWIFGKDTGFAVYVNIARRVRNY